MNKDLQIELLKKDVSFKDKEIDKLEERINKARNNILKDISIIKTIPMTKQEIVFRLNMTALILKGEENE